MEYSWIEETLAAGSIPIDAKDIRSLHENGIRAILSLTEQPLTRFQEITPELFSELGITYFHVPVPDQFPPTLEQAQTILQIIHTATRENQPLFLHCHAGIGRTGTVLHLYYLAQGKSFKEAQALVRQRRIQSILLSEDQLKFLQDFAQASHERHP